MQQDQDGGLGAGGSESGASPLAAGTVRNSGQPIQLTEVTLCGVSAEAVRGAGQVRIWTRLTLTSDDAIFHRIVDSMTGAIDQFARRAGSHVNLRRADSVLLIIRPDATAELWVDTAAVSLSVFVKREVHAGTAVFESDIADVVALDFPCVEIGPKDKVLYLFRQDWRFALFFDFNPDGNLSRSEVTRTLGTLHRRLRYRHLYDTLANEAVFGGLVAAGWFPFVEMMGPEFKSLAEAFEAGFPLDDAEAELLRKFDDARVERMLARWIAKPSFRSKEALLKSAIDAYKAENAIAVIKIVLTEMEGILAEAHHAQMGTRPKLKQLLEFARESAEQKTGAPDTLLFPAAFARYLENYTFANFDPSAGGGTAGSRHAVGHGAATAESYTRTRALQALLTLDQFAFYF